MNNTTKNQQDRDVVCRNHLTKSERELYRVCPSKLSKRELENLYFALLENNLDMKKTIHTQQDKLKVLSTRLQRMTAMQRSSAGKEKNCCPSKGLANEQKETILELKRANERMTDRIRVLNMRLCSAKQFVKCSPPQVIGRCPRCASAASAFKNASMSALNAKPSEVCVKMNAVSCQYLSDDIPECPKKQMVETETSTERCPQTPCNENRCRTTMDEMKQKIVNLQEELAKTHTDYCNRITNLENDVSYVHNENMRIKNHNVANENAIQMAEKQAELLKQKLREAERQINDITMELTIEKRKVAELETSLKLTSSSQMVQIIEKLNLLNKQRPQSPMEILQAASSRCSYRSTRQFPEGGCSPKVELQPSPKDKDARSPKSDDSGCTDMNRSTERDDENIDSKEVSKMNQEMWRKISDLQTQLDTLRIQAGSSSKQKKPEQDRSFDSEKYENEMAVITITEDRSNVVLEVQDLSPFGVKKTRSQADRNTITSTANKEGSGTSDDKADSSRQPCAEAVIDKSKDIKSEGSSISSTEIQARSKSQIKFDFYKKDTDNRYQIPGPIPSLTRNNDIKKTIKNYQSPTKTSKDLNELSDERKCEGNYCETHCNHETCSMHKNTEDETKTQKATPEQKTPLNETRTPNDCANENGQIGDKLKQDSLDLNHRKLTKDNLDFGKNKQEDSVRVKDGSNCSYFHASDIVIGPSSEEKNAKNCEVTSSEVNTEEYESCASHVTVCRCPRAPCDVTPRTCSGTRLPRAALAGMRLRHCACATFGRTALSPGKRVPVDTAVQSLQRRDSTSQSICSHQTTPLYNTNKSSGVNRPVSCGRRSSIKNDDDRRCNGYKDSATQSVKVTRRDSATYNAGPLSKDFATQNMPPQRRDSATYTAEALPSKRDSATYTAGAPAQAYGCSRATSPANTEREISSLSDLPPERDGRSRIPLSPGETQYVSSTSPSHSHSPAPDYSALSDGELPAQAQHAVRSRRLSFGEKPTYVDPLPEDSNSQMEATLNAISAELARCRQLLANSRPQESRVYRLHAAGGTRRLPDARTRTAVFTLHIGTLVLSDEAVLKTRDKSLVLTWKFYDQSVAMTRMRTGRVVLFDFCTEYDVTFSEEFIEYMKQEDMPLTICDMNEQDAPFATCALPLRDALLHANRRADMSLALMAGPGMPSGEGADALVSGGELGVLDLWCRLRVDRALLRALHGTARQFQDSEERNATRYVDNTPDDELSQPSQEIAFGSNPRPRGYMWEHAGSGVGVGEPSPEFNTTANPVVDEFSPHLPESSRNNRRTSLQLQAKQFSERRASFTNKSLSGLEKWPAENIRHRSSGLIASEVAANIRSTDEMKQALERNVQPMSKFKKMDDEISIAQSSIGSAKYLAEKHQLKKIKPNKLPLGMTVPDALQDMLKKERKISTATAEKQNLSRRTHVPFSHNSREEDEELEASLTRAYNSVGPYRGIELSKKTVKYTDDAPDYEEPEKQDSSEDNSQSINITVLWLALNEECEAMLNPQVQRLYVAYSFLGRRGADLETPVSLPKPKHYADKCYFNFKKTFHLQDADLPLLGHMSRCRAGRAAPHAANCVVFSVVSEPPEDPLGLSSCTDIGHAYLYLGDILAYSAGGAGYTEVVPVRSSAGAVCGVLALRVDGLHVLRHCLSLTHSFRDLA